MTRWKKEIVTGQFEVKQVFKISKVGTVAGGMVTEGKVHSKDKGRVVRDGIVVHTAPIDALKRYKDDVKEVVTGLECGISLVNYNDLQTGDMIETFTEIEVEQKTLRYVPKPPLISIGKTRRFVFW